MDLSVFDFSDYKVYLRRHIGDFRQRRGKRTALARALDCQPTFVSQVLNGDLNLSLEQGEKTNRFLSHNEEESVYFLLLLQKARAGTRELTAHFHRQLQQLLSQRKVLTHRLGQETTLSKEEQAVYYSSWHFSALHMAVAVPGLQTRESIATYFALPPRKVSEVLDYLCAHGLAVLENGRYSIGTTRIRLGRESNHLLRHHTNWRVQAIESLDRETESDLHYSGVLCLSRAAQEKIKDRILEMMKEHLAISDQSSEEEICVYNIDLFGLQR